MNTRQLSMLLCVYTMGIAGCHKTGSHHSMHHVSGKTDHMRDQSIQTSGYFSTPIFVAELRRAVANMNLPEVPDTHGHESMAVGAYARHTHTCSMCNATYSHAHTKKASGACSYRHLCVECQTHALPTCIRSSP